MRSWNGFQPVNSSNLGPFVQVRWGPNRNLRIPNEVLKRFEPVNSTNLGPFVKVRWAPNTNWRFPNEVLKWFEPVNSTNWGPFVKGPQTNKACRDNSLSVMGGHLTSENIAPSLGGKERDVIPYSPPYEWKGSYTGQCKTPLAEYSSPMEPGW
jgi:hypothetical protein